MSATKSRSRKKARSARKNVHRESGAIRMGRGLGQGLGKLAAAIGPPLRRVGRPLTAALAVAAMGLGFICAHDYLTQCAYFEARQVLLEGTDHLSGAAAMAQAGVAPGVNILSVNLTAARKNLLNHPWIADAQVRRELPDTLRIRIREQDPLAVIDIEGGYVINRAGRIFKPASVDDPPDLPRVRGLSFADAPVGDSPAGPAFDAVLEVLNMGALPDSALPVHLIAAISVDAEMGLTVEPVAPAGGAPASSDVASGTTSGVAPPAGASPAGASPVGTPPSDVPDARPSDPAPDTADAGGRVAASAAASTVASPLGGLRAIKLGFSDYAAKYRRLAEIIAYLKQQGQLDRIESIDLNDLNRVVINPLKSEPLLDDQKEV